MEDWDADLSPCNFITTFFPAERSSSISLPVLPFLVFFLEKSKENHQKKQGFFIPTEPLKSLEKKGKKLKKNKEILAGQKKQGIPKKQGKEEQGCIFTTAHLRVLILHLMSLPVTPRPVNAGPFRNTPESDKIFPGTEFHIALCGNGVLEGGEIFVGLLCSLPEQKTFVQDDDNIRRSEQVSINEKSFRKLCA